MLNAMALQAQITHLVFTSGSQHFTDGQTSIGSGTYNAAVLGQTAPFDAIIGSDAGASGPDFDASWTMTYGTPPTVLAATLKIGLWDFDANASGNQVKLFSAAGVDLTSNLSTLVEAAGGADKQYRVFTITLPSSTFSTLETGSPSFQFTLQGPGLGVLGETTYNGAGMDFAQLDLTVVPEPSVTVSLGAVSGIFLVWLHRRKRKASF